MIKEKKDKKQKIILFIILSLIGIGIILVSVFLISYKNDNHQKLFLLAQTYYEEEEYPTAKLFCNAILVEDPDHDQARQLLQKIQQKNMLMISDEETDSEEISPADSEQLAQYIEELKYIKSIDLF